jgi:xylose isomerase
MIFFFLKRLNDDVVKRVFETADFVHKILQRDGLKVGGVGHEAVLRVRLVSSTFLILILIRIRVNINF